MGRRRYTLPVDLKTYTIEGAEYRVRVAPEGGVFYTEVAGQRLKADTLAELEKLLRAATRRRKVAVAVPASILGRGWHERQYQRSSWVAGHNVQHVTLYGLSADGSVKVRDDRTGDKLTALDLRNADIVRRLTPDEEKEYTTLLLAKQAAKDAFYAFEKKVEFDAEEAVKDAIGAKLDTPDDPPEENEDPR